MFAILCFGYSFLWYLDISIWPHVSMEQNFRLFVVMGFELLALLCWFLLQQKRDRLVLKNAQNLFNTKESNIVELKAMWFKSTLGIPTTEYLRLAEDINKLLDLREKHKSNLSIDRNQIINLIFSGDSKNRLLAMFMGVSAAIVGLCISGGASIENVFAFFDGESITSLVGGAAIFSSFIIMSYLMFRYVLLVILMFFELFVDKLDGMNSGSTRRARTFINQLIALHQLPKGRVKNV